MKLISKTFILAALLIAPVRYAAAQSDGNPYGSPGEDELEDVADGRDNIQDEGRTFSGPMQRLLDLAGEKEAASGPAAAWGKFERYEPQSAEQYDAFFQWRMEAEARKPLPEKPKYKSDLDSLRKELETIKPANRRDEEHFFRHIYRPDPAGGSGAVRR